MFVVVIFVLIKTWVSAHCCPLLDRQIWAILCASEQTLSPLPSRHYQGKPLRDRHRWSGPVESAFPGPWQPQGRSDDFGRLSVLSQICLKPISIYNSLWNLSKSLNLFNPQFLYKIASHAVSYVTGSAQCLAHSRGSVDDHGHPFTSPHPQSHL